MNYAPLPIVKCFKCASVLYFGAWCFHLSTSRIYCEKCAPAGCVVFQ